MKITCNIIEDLLPLYMDDAVSEDSKELVEAHLKECPSCRKMLEEIKRENHLRAASPDAKLVQANKAGAKALAGIRRKIRQKRILSVALAVVLVLAVGGIGHYWYYDKESYISWDDAAMSIEDGKVYSSVNPTGRLKSVISVDQKNMFFMLSETAWTRKQYPTDSTMQTTLFTLQDFQDAYNRGKNADTDESSFPSGIENVYYVDPENVKEAYALWDYENDPQEAQKKEKELAAKCRLIWSAADTSAETTSTEGETK